MSVPADPSLEPLRPRKNEAVMDLVAQAGIDVSPWAQRKDGAGVENPRANPNYCYEWAFGGDQEPTALCVWHRSVQVDKDVLVYEDNLRDFASVDRVAIDRGSPSGCSVPRSPSSHARPDIRLATSTRISKIRTRSSHPA